MTDLERAQAWWVRAIGYVAPGDEQKIASLAQEFAAARAALVREFLTLEWCDEVHSSNRHVCPRCDGQRKDGHSRWCSLDRKLTEAGYADQASRDAEREGRSPA